MKQVLKHLALALAIIMVTGCWTTIQAQTADSLLVIKNRSFAGIRIGMRMSKVPQSIPGIYSQYDERREGTVLNCTNSDGDWVMIISDDDENEIIDGIYIRINGAIIEGTDIEVGVPFSKIANTPGLVKDKDLDGTYIYKKFYEVQLDENNLVYAIYFHL